jgi:NADPH:quinone reductase-like Zn-dependent oxidoreductase
LNISVPRCSLPPVVPLPAIGAYEVLIALDTAGVGPWDTDIRAGWYREGKPQFPLVLGVVGAELVREMGADLAINGKHGDIKEAAGRFAPDGVDAILASGRGRGAGIRAGRKPGGRLAYPNGVEPEPKNAARRENHSP